MNDGFTIPALMELSIGKKYEAVLALSLSSVLAAHLMHSASEQGPDPDRGMGNVQQHHREAFLRAFADWPSTIVLELHWCSIPDLNHVSQGALLIHLLLRAASKDSEEAKATVVKAYFRLKALLSTHFRHLFFKPVIDDRVLPEIVRPFEPTVSFQVSRRKKRIALSNPLSRPGIGYGKTASEKTRAETIHHLYPWQPFLSAEDLFPRALLSQMAPLQLVVRLRPSSPKEKPMAALTETIDRCELFLSAGKRYQVTLSQQVSVLRDTSLAQLIQLNEAGIDAGVFLFSPSAMDSAAVSGLMHLVLSGFWNSSAASAFVGGYAVKEVDAEKAYRIDFLPEAAIAVREAAGVFHLPQPPINDVPGLPVRRWRSGPATAGIGGKDHAASIHLFDNDHLGQKLPIGLGKDDRMRHTFICGQTGCGKSTFMEHMILQDIQKGHGVAVIDPHGDMVESVLGRMDVGRADDVVLFDVLDRDMPVGFNLLEWGEPNERDLIIDEMLNTLDLMYDLKQTGGPIFETHMRNILKLLMGDAATDRGDFVPTVVDIVRCYLDGTFRKWLTSTIHDQQVKDFITEIERPSYGDVKLSNMTPYITSKFGRFVSDDTLKRVFGQQQTSFDFDEILNGQKILLVKLGRGRFGSSVCSLLAAQLLLKIKLAAMARGDKAKGERKDFFLYVDEAGLVPGHSLGELLSEARKFRLGVTLASQYTRQLTQSLATQRKDTLLNSIYGNVGTTVIFRLGKEDAKEMSSQFWPEFSVLDIMRLPNFCGYARMQLDHQPSPPFSFQTRQVVTEYSYSQAESVRAKSRFVYGTRADEVDRQIKMVSRCREE